MIEIPDEFRALFTATIRQHDDSYIIEIPANEVQVGNISEAENYHVAIVDSPETSSDQSDSSDKVDSSRDGTDHPAPPVTEGEIREVTVKTVGEKGDGIANVENGYVVIVPRAEPGDTPTIKIESVKPNVAFASVVKQSV